VIALQVAYSCLLFFFLLLPSKLQAAVQQIRVDAILQALQSTASYNNSVIPKEELTIYICIIIINTIQTNTPSMHHHS